jgi:outer membrane biosynthesis protein TonB
MEFSKGLAVVATVCAACARAPAPPVAAPTAPVAASAPGATAATSSSTAPTAPSAPAAPGDVIASNRAAFDACYAQARAKDPTLGRTKVEMTFTINADGRPQTVDLKYRNRMDDGAKECMRDAALSLQFPASMQGTQTATIVFTPPGS